MTTAAPTTSARPDSLQPAHELRTRRETDEADEDVQAERIEDPQRRLGNAAEARISPSAASRRRDRPAARRPPCDRPSSSRPTWSAGRPIRRADHDREAHRHHVGPVGRPLGVADLLGDALARARARPRASARRRARASSPAPRAAPGPRARACAGRRRAQLASLAQLARACARRSSRFVSTTSTDDDRDVEQLGILGFVSAQRIGVADEHRSRRPRARSRSPARRRRSSSGSIMSAPRRIRSTNTRSLAEARLELGDASASIAAGIS